MLSHIIPCCRKDKSKRDFIESLLSKQGSDQTEIKKIEEDIKFDEIMDCSTQAKLKEPSEFRVNANQVGICSVAHPAFSPAKELRSKLKNLFHYHQFKGNQLITNKFLPRRNFQKPNAGQSKSMARYSQMDSMQSAQNNLSNQQRDELSSPKFR